MSKEQKIEVLKKLKSVPGLWENEAQVAYAAEVLGVLIEVVGCDEEDSSRGPTARDHAEHHLLHIL